MAEEYALSQVLSCTDTKMTQQAYLSIRMFNGYDVACGYKDGANYVLEKIEDYLENYTLPKDSLLKFYILSIFF